MTLSPEQMLRLQMEDGIVEDESHGATAALGFDPQRDREFRQQLRRVLTPLEVPPLASRVMARIAACSVPVGDAIRDGAEGSLGVSRAVMGTLGIGMNLGEQYRTALITEAGEMDSVWPSVADAIGVDAGTSLADMLRGAIADEAAYGETMSDGAVPFGWRLPTTIGVVVAAAAALLLWIGATGTTAKHVAEKIAEGPVHIEHLDVGAANAVQVLQLGDEAPTIILIEDAAQQQEERE